MDLGMKDKVAIVTGAGSQVGYGKRIALVLAGEGCHIVVVDRDLEGAEKTAAAVREVGRKAIAVKADVRNQAELNQMVETAIKEMGHIDILVNNAGVAAGFKPFVDKTAEECNFDFEVNMIGQMNVARAVLPHMISRKYGRIVNTTGGIGHEGSSTYGAAKSGIIAWTKSLALEVAQHGVIVNAVRPGLGRTGLGSSNKEGIDRAPYEMFEHLSRLKRLCTPEDVAYTVAFLASDRCSFMLGEEIDLKTY